MLPQPMALQSVRRRNLPVVRHPQTGFGSRTF